MINNTEFQEQLYTEVYKLIENKWLFLNTEWLYIQNKFNHRTEIKKTKNNKIYIIKDILLNN